MDWNGTRALLIDSNHSADRYRAIDPEVYKRMVCFIAA
ncbi:hypothetical protein ASZ90_013568 [hydrocarbon metagenome]|uniref:Uncharacterized protein n=1 Tax=hydrocarbon metagenome TaxID=938273 RepID=A0A0W8F782_9ZZZZ